MQRAFLAPAFPASGFLGRRSAQNRRRYKSFKDCALSETRTPIASPNEKVDGRQASTPGDTPAPGSNRQR